MQSNETIAAVATAPGEAGIAIIRISGPDAKGIAAKVAGRGVAEASAGSFFHSRFSDPRDGRAIDDGMVLVFGAPRSYTGEDVVELQGHGGRMQSSRLLDAVLAAGARLAGPGEFTRRAFLNGKVDLTQAEAVADLIAARTERAARVARAQLDGALGRRLAALYDCVADICADMEAWLDLEEGEIGDSAVESATARIEALAAGIDSALASAREGRLVREGALAVISGAPNVGKSSLLNALLGTERAIVSPVPGTTRDTVEECVAIDGIPLRIADTAGLRDAPCEIEREGVARARTLISRADIHLRILDASGAPLSAQLEEAVGELPAESTIIVANKCDIAPDDCDFEALRGWNSCRVSAKTGAGLDDLRRAISAALGIPRLSGGDADMAVAARHREELAEARAHAGAALACAADGPEGIVLAANELRGAAEALGRITGRVFSDELLDRIFSRFCVGK